MDKLHSATTIRQPAYAEILVDSMDRYKQGSTSFIDPIPTTSSSWRTNLPQYVLNGYFTRLAITQVQFAWNLPTIITGYNDKFILIDSNVGDVTITLPQGYYTPNVMATTLQALIRLATTDNDYSVVFAEGSFVISNTNAGTECCPQGGDFSSPDENERIYARCLHTLGFQLVQSATFNDTFNPYVGTTPTMLATRYIDILSSYISKFQDVKDSSTQTGLLFNNKIARIYAVPPSNRIEIAPDAGPSANPFVMTIDYATPKMIMWNPDEALSNFDIQLRDENGDLVPFLINGNVGYGCEYAFTMLASES
jgi:hypothetical protein